MAERGTGTRKVKQKAAAPRAKKPAAPRAKSATGKPSAKKSAASSKPTAAAKRSVANGMFEALERERDQLKEQLADAMAQIARLQEARDEAVNRIDWAIDSLHNVLEKDA